MGKVQLTGVVSETGDEVCRLDDGKDAGEDTHTHAHANANLFMEAHLQVPNQEPGEDGKDKVGHGRPDTCKDGKVHHWHGVDTVPRNTIIPLLRHGSAADEESDAAWPHKEVDADDTSPDEDLVPAFDSQTEERETEGRFGEGDADDAKEFADEEELVGRWECFDVDLPDVRTQIPPCCQAFQGDGGY